MRALSVMRAALPGTAWAQGPGGIAERGQKRVAGGSCERLAGPVDGPPVWTWGPGYEVDLGPEGTGLKAHVNIQELDGRAEDERC